MNEIANPLIESEAFPAESLVDVFPILESSFTLSRLFEEFNKIKTKEEPLVSITKKLIGISTTINSLLFRYLPITYVDNNFIEGGLPIPAPIFAPVMAVMPEINFMCLELNEIYAIKDEEKLVLSETIDVELLNLFDSLNAID